MEEVVVDACCVINVSAGGPPRPVFESVGVRWYLPTTVWEETRQLTFPNDECPERASELQALLLDGVFVLCDLTTQDERDLFVTLATQLDDGEAMALAIAKCRGWTIATDDRVARRLARELSVPVLTTPDVVKRWVDTVRPSREVLRSFLQNLERLGRYKPSSRELLFAWWNDKLSGG